MSTSTYSGIVTLSVTSISPNSVSSVLSPASAASLTATLISAYVFELLSIAVALQLTGQQSVISPHMSHTRIARPGSSPSGVLTTSYLPVDTH